MTFTFQPSIVIDSGVHGSLHSNCYHLDLKIFYPPSYERTLVHFKNANSDPIKRSIDIFDREYALNNLDVNDQVSVFNPTIMNIVTNFIPNETCDGRDRPWINSFIEYLIFFEEVCL